MMQYTVKEFLKEIISRTALLRAVSNRLIQIPMYGIFIYFIFNKAHLKAFDLKRILWK